MRVRALGAGLWWAAVLSPLACAGSGRPGETTVVNLTPPPASAAKLDEPPEPASEPVPRKLATLPPGPPAGPPGPDGEADRERARELFSEGAALYQQGDYARARDAFQAAYDLVPEQALLFNIGTAEMRLGDIVAACGHFRAYVAQGDPADVRIQTVRAQVAQRCVNVP